MNHSTRLRSVPTKEPSESGGREKMMLKLMTKFLRRTALAAALAAAGFALPLSCPAAPGLDLAQDALFKLDKDRNLVFTNVASGADKPADFRTLIKAVKNVSEPESFEILAVVPQDGEGILAVTRKHGLLFTRDGGENWERIDSGLPREVVYPFIDHGLTKPIMSVSISSDRKRIAALFPESLYLSRDGGRTFAAAPLAGAETNVEFLCVAWHPDDANLILIGTAEVGTKINNGVYVSRNGGASVSGIYEGLPGEPTAHPNYFEIVTAVCFGEEEDVIYAGMGNGGGVYRGSLTDRRFERIADKELYTYPNGDFYSVENLFYRNGALFIATNRPWRKIVPVVQPDPGAHTDRLFRELFLTEEGFVSMREASGLCRSLRPAYVPPRSFPPDPKVYGKKGLYISYTFTQEDNYPKLIRLLNRLNLNAVIINLKDDYGNLRVKTDDPEITKVQGRVSPYVKFKETVAKLHADGIYVIGRMVVFKDSYLYDYENHKYAVKVVGGAPLTKGPEKWVDPFSEFAWDYNIACARAAEASGVDEIQFDYIRLPDLKGDAFGRARYDFQKKGQLAREALVSFLKKARSQLKAPISIDLFGYQAVYKFGRWIGQDITEMAAQVDAVSPMFYPSHYSGGYAANYGDQRIYYTIYLSCKRALELIGNAHLRPYVQGFYYRNNEDDYCVDYIGWEMNGLKASGTADFIFWNDLSEYVILVKGMRRYLGDKVLPTSTEIKKDLPKKMTYESIIEPPQ
jgi:hypothetical protein